MNTSSRVALTRHTSTRSLQTTNGCAGPRPSARAPSFYPTCPVRGTVLLASPTTSAHRQRIPIAFVSRFPAIGCTITRPSVVMLETRGKISRQATRPYSSRSDLPPTRGTLEPTCHHAFRPVPARSACSQSRGKWRRQAAQTQDPALQILQQMVQVRIPCELESFDRGRR